MNSLYSIIVIILAVTTFIALVLMLDAILVPFLNWQVAFLLFIFWLHLTSLIKMILKVFRLGCCSRGKNLKSSYLVLFPAAHPKKICLGRVPMC